MSTLKKIGAPLAAVAVTAAMGLSLLVGQGTAEAANSVTTLGTVTISNITNVNNGNNTGTALAVQPVLTAATAATDIPSGTTVIVTAPAGYRISAQGTATGSATANLFGVGAVGTLASDGSTITYTTTANNGAAETVTWAGLAVVPLTNTSTTGVITIKIGAAAAVTLGTITQTGALTAPYTLTLSAPAPSVPADGTISTSVTAQLRDANSAIVTNTPVAWTVSLGKVSTGSAKTGTSITSATTGNAAQTYRGAGGVAATDTIIATVSTLNVVGTLSMPMVTSTGTTASTTVINAPQSLAVAATVTSVSPGYISGQTGTNLSVKVSDAAGLGVNGQVILITADKGFVMNGHSVACPGSTKAVSPTTATLAPIPGATTEAGIIQLTYCGNQLDAAGTATLTAQNVTTSMANATQTISMAGRPSKVEATVTGTAITASVMDAAGNAVADGTPIRFTMSANAGAVSTACTTTSNGKASAVVALIAASGTVIVSSDFNETGTAATCAASGTQQVATSVMVGAGGGVVTPPATGAGGFATAPVYSASSLAQAVFNGGSVGQLEGAVTAGNGTGVWAQDSNGVFVLYIVNGGFVNDAFNAAFPNGFIGVTAVTVVGK
ncbi:MAG: hypothetical protein O2822_04050 [Chloroflexi bacterium]|nr:hypothetical protein [Chloroflexota bacterium]